jgi:hypothetical protein
MGGRRGEELRIRCERKDVFEMVASGAEEGLGRFQGGGVGRRDVRGKMGAVAWAEAEAEAEAEADAEAGWIEEEGPSSEVHKVVLYSLQRLSVMAIPGLHKRKMRQGRNVKGYCTS